MGIFWEEVSAGPLAIYLGGHGGLRLEGELGVLSLSFAWPLPPPAAFAPGPSVRRPSEAAVGRSQPFLKVGDSGARWLRSTPQDLHLSFM